MNWICILLALAPQDAGSPSPMGLQCAQRITPQGPMLRVEWKTPLPAAAILLVTIVPERERLEAGTFLTDEKDADVSRLVEAGAKSTDALLRRAGCYRVTVRFSPESQVDPRLQSLEALSESQKVLFDPPEILRTVVRECRRLDAALRRIAGVAEQMEKVRDRQEFGDLRKQLETESEGLDLESPACMASTGEAAVEGFRSLHQILLLSAVDPGQVPDHHATDTTPPDQRKGKRYDRLGLVADLKEELQSLLKMTPSTTAREAGLWIVRVLRDARASDVDGDLRLAGQVHEELRKMFTENEFVKAVGTALGRLAAAGVAASPERRLAVLQELEAKLRSAPPP